MLMYQEVLSGRHHANELLQVPCMALNAACGSEADGGRFLPNRKVRRAIQGNAGL